MAANGTKTPGALSARDRQIAGLIASGLGYVEAGARLNLSERTIHRAMARPELRAEVDRIRERTVEAGLGKLCDGFIAAVDELRRLVLSGEPKDSVKLGAVKLTIEAALKVRESVTLARRLAALEGMSDEPDGPGASTGAPSGRAPDPPGIAGDAERTASGPGADALTRWDEAGPVAGEALAGELEPGAVPGIASDWEE